MRARLVGTALALPTAMTMYSYCPKEPDVDTDSSLIRNGYSIARCDASLSPSGKTMEKTLAGTLQPLPARDQVWKTLSQSAAPFDVLVIGGGATGTGCALDAQTRYVV